MRLPQALAAVRQVEDLTLLIAAWGHEPRWEPLEAAGWARAESWRRAARVGDANGFAWYGIEAENPAAAAATLAQRLARRGELGATIALDPDQRTLALAVQAVARRSRLPGAGPGPDRESRGAGTSHQRGAGRTRNRPGLFPRLRGCPRPIRGCLAPDHRGRGSEFARPHPVLPGPLPLFRAEPRMARRPRRVPGRRSGSGTRFRMLPPSQPLSAAVLR